VNVPVPESEQYNALVAMSRAEALSHGNDIVINPHAQNPADRRTLSRDELVAMSGRQVNPERFATQLNAAYTDRPPPEVAVSATMLVGQVDQATVSGVVPTTAGAPAAGVRLPARAWSVPPPVVPPPPLAPPGAPDPGRQITLRFDLGPLGVQPGRYDHVRLDGRHLILAYHHDRPSYVPPLRTPRDPAGPLLVSLPDVPTPVQAYFLGTQIDFLGYEILVLPVCRAVTQSAAPVVPDEPEGSRW
jgi:hypothetical protein